MRATGRGETVFLEEPAHRTGPYMVNLSKGSYIAMHENGSAVVLPRLFQLMQIPHQNIAIIFIKPQELCPVNY